MAQTQKVLQMPEAALSHSHWTRSMNVAVLKYMADP